MVDRVTSFVFIDDEVFSTFRPVEITAFLNSQKFFQVNFNNLIFKDLFDLFLEEKKAEMSKISYQFNNLSKKQTYEFYLDMYDKQEKPRNQHFLNTLQQFITKDILTTNNCYLLSRYLFGFRNKGLFLKWLENITKFQPLELDIEKIRLEDNYYRGENVFTFRETNILLTYHNLTIKNKKLHII